MLQTVEAEIDVNGNVHLLEPLKITKPSRALVTVLDTENGSVNQKGNITEVLKLIESPEFKNRKSYSEEEIESQIQEARNSWE